MDDFKERLAKLSPQQRALLEAKISENAKGRTTPIGIPMRDPGSERQLSFAQERFWFLDQLIHPSFALNTGIAFRIEGPIDESAMGSAIDAIVERHDLLRSRFPANEKGQATVDIAPVEAPSPMAIESMADATNEEIRAKLTEFLQHPFDLANGPLFNALLTRTSPTESALAIRIHHVIADAHSFRIVLDELVLFYESYTRNALPAIDPLELVYADFSAWQRSDAGMAQQKDDLDYWIQQLESAPKLLELAHDYQRPSEQSYQGDQVFHRLSSELKTRLDSLAEKEGVTPYVILFAALNILLHRVSRQDDIVVGTPAAHWPDDRLRRVIGPFINMLPLRSRYRADIDARDYIQELKEAFFAALDHQLVPFERIVESLNPSRDMGISPIFQVAFMYHADSEWELELPGCKCDWIRLPSFAAKYDITVFALFDSRGLELSIEYASDLFSRSSMQRFLGRMERVLETIVRSPETSVDELPTIPKAEEDMLLQMGQGAVLDKPLHKTVLDFVQETAFEDPSKIALTTAGKPVSYDLLKKRSYQIASQLLSLGVGPGDRLGVCLDRNPDLVATLLAILHIGGTYIPLDPAFPVDRLAYMLDDANASLLLHDRTAPTELLDSERKRFSLDQNTDNASETTGARDFPDVDRAAQVAYIIYTSGSTGRPKGVEVPHQALMNFLHSMQDSPGFSEADRLLAVTTISFDISGLELFLPLISSGSLHIAKAAEVVDGNRLAEFIENKDITILQATPATFRLMLACGWQGKPDIKLLCGGEALPRDLAKELLTRCDELWNMYGPTETTIWSTCSVVSDAEDIHIGRPIANTNVYIVDERMRLVPCGAEGELAIGGKGLADGYRNLEGLTSEKFKASPFASGDRLFLTGDQARYRPDGNIECLGRIDGQVKLRGFRIELGEIEASLSEHPKVGQAAARVVDTGEGEQLLAAYYVANDAERVATEEFRDLLRQRLPEYMVPAVYVPIAAIPLTANGKVDRKALPNTIESLANETCDGEPVGETEKIVAKIMAETLGIERMGRRGNFFDLGGHSILAVRIFSEIEKTFGRRLSIATLFRDPTPARLARLIDKNPAPVKGRSTCIVPIRTSGDHCPFFCIHGAGGNVLFYRDLANQLGDNYPFYGLQSVGLDGGEAPLQSVDEMAARYLAEIRSIQPKGPYHIGGYCLGGTISYHIARLFSEQGEEVRLLALMDTYNFSVKARSSSFTFLLQKLSFHCRNVFSMPPRLWPEYISRKLQVAKAGELSLIIKGITGKLERDESADSGNQRIEELNHVASLSYQPLPYKGKLTLFNPSTNYSYYDKPDMGWTDLVDGGIETVTLPMAPHAMLVEPFVETLASELAKRIH